MLNHIGVSHLIIQMLQVNSDSLAVDSMTRNMLVVHFS